MSSDLSRQFTLGAKFERTRAFVDCEDSESRITVRGSISLNDDCLLSGVALVSSQNLNLGNHGNEFEI
jgi:hypothetical protein